MKKKRHPITAKQLNNFTKEELFAFFHDAEALSEFVNNPPPDASPTSEIDITRYSDTQDEMGFEAFYEKYNTREKVLAEFGWNKLKE